MIQKIIDPYWSPQLHLPKTSIHLPGPIVTAWLRPIFSKRIGGVENGASEASMKRQIWWTKNGQVLLRLGEQQ